MFALEQFGNAAGVFDHLDTALQFTAGIVQHLAMLSGDDPADFVRVLFQQFAEAEHDAGAPLWRGRGPVRRRRVCRGYGLFHRGPVGHAHPAGGGSCGGIEHILHAARSGDFLAGYVVFNYGQ